MMMTSFQRRSYASLIEIIISFTWSELLTQPSVHYVCNDCVHSTMQGVVLPQPCIDARVDLDPIPTFPCVAFMLQIEKRNCY